jgi:hypothetical protein
VSANRLDDPGSRLYPRSLHTPFRDRQNGYAVTAFDGSGVVAIGMIVRLAAGCASARRCAMQPSSKLAGTLAASQLPSPIPVKPRAVTVAF